MDFSHIFLFFLFFFPTLITAQSCSVSKCINDDFAIRFPFRIPDQQPARCGYPGFNLACNKAGVTTVNLSASEYFLVRGIDYATQQIQLYDSDDCLPRRFLQGLNKLNFSNSPFIPLFSQNITFLSCPPQFTMSHFPIIGCLSNSTNSILATSSTSFVKSMSTSCTIMTTLPVPVSNPDETNQFSTNLNGDLVLTWYSPACGICETEGRLCGYKSNSGQGIACFDKYTSGKSSALCNYLLSLCLNYIVPKSSKIHLFQSVEWFLKHILHPNCLRKTQSKYVIKYWKKKRTKNHHFLKIIITNQCPNNTGGITYYPKLQAAVWILDWLLVDQT